MVVFGVLFDTSQIAGHQTPKVHYEVSEIGESISKQAIGREIRCHNPILNSASEITMQQFPPVAHRHQRLARVFRIGDPARLPARAAVGRDRLERVLARPRALLRPHGLEAVRLGVQQPRRVRERPGGRAVPAHRTRGGGHGCNRWNDIHQVRLSLRVFESI